MLVVAADVDPEDSFEVPSVDDQDPVEALAAHGADPPFDEGVRARCPHGRADCSDALGAERLIERRRELAVAIVDQKPGFAECVRSLPRWPDTSLGRIYGHHRGVVEVVVETTARVLLRR